MLGRCTGPVKSLGPSIIFVLKFILILIINHIILMLILILNNALDFFGLKANIILEIF